MMQLGFGIENPSRKCIVDYSQEYLGVACTDFLTSDLIGIVLFAFLSGLTTIVVRPPVDFFVFLHLHTRVGDRLNQQPNGSHFTIHTFA